MMNRLWISFRIFCLTFSKCLPDSIMKICFHILENQIKIFIVFGPDHIVEFDKIGMIKFMKEDNFPKGSLSISRMLKSIEYFFKSKYLACLLINNLPHMTVSTTPELLGQGVFLKNMSLNFFAHFL